MYFSIHARYEATLTTQSNFPNMDTGPAGLMNEQTFNEALAAALRNRRKAWRDDEADVEHLTPETSIFLV